MRLTLLRDELHPGVTLGRLWVDGRFFGFALEDEDRGLTQTDPSTWTRKVHGSTAIPVGEYAVRMTMSQRFGRRMPLLVDTGPFRGVRIHAGNTPADTLGCVLAGLRRDTLKGTIAQSRDACAWLYPRIEAAPACFIEVGYPGGEYDVGLEVA